jgi:hypothetical protein
MLVMTPLTLWIALKNPVTDCGCFGDALIISNWETIYKNVVLLAFILLILIFNKQFKQVFLPYFEWIAVLIFIIIGVGIAVYSLRNLPIIDFLPYKKGVNIPEAMMIPKANKQINTRLLLFTKKMVCKKNSPSKITQKAIQHGNLLIRKLYLFQRVRTSNTRFTYYTRTLRRYNRRYFTLRRLYISACYVRFK